ncbi:very short patch repair endonuclease [Conexibacter sp. SYSU D00693]|uniref:very short patch repair endonuclease n=1 Tax=Conexibacter sp. SYSU D00693 TaxID=2812560 RepID=UPI00196B5E8D|nr:very short patch repair endonuclease [Conexibacter sp. SYSU D00693]
MPRLCESALHRRGERFRKDLPLRWGDGPRQITRGDVVFTRVRVAVFVDGCFWHGCPDHFHAPRHNAAYWRQKLLANQARDARNTAALRARGWTVLRFWEHEEPEDVAAIVCAVVRARRSRPERRPDPTTTKGPHEAGPSTSTTTSGGR